MIGSNRLRHAAFSPRPLALPDLQDSEFGGAGQQRTIKEPWPRAGRLKRYIQRDTRNGRVENLSQLSIRVRNIPLSPN